MKAAPLLRAWLQRLDQQNVRIAPRYQWVGWTPDGALSFDTPNGPQQRTVDITLLALGGASWPRLGSTGTWTSYLTERGICCIPWHPSNCGFAVAWSPFFQDNCAGTPLKTVELSFAGRTIRSPVTLTTYGIEGHGIYALSSGLRDAITSNGKAIFYVDLAPDRSHHDLIQRLGSGRGSKSLTTYLKRTLGFDRTHIALLHENGRSPAALSPHGLAELIKAVPIVCHAPCPLDEAISSAGGIALSEVDSTLHLKKLPGVFCAGEMLDWEAPTGGYLLTACLALGAGAAHGILSTRRNRKC